MTNLKKVLSAMLSATVLVASGAMMASAEDAKSLVSFDPADWVVSGEDTSVMEIEAADGAISFSNTNGQYPAAYYLFDEPITVDPDTAVLNYDMTIGGSTNFNLFCNTTSPDNFTGKDTEYFSPAAKLDLGSATVNGEILSVMARQSRAARNCPSWGSKTDAITKTALLPSTASTSFPLVKRGMIPR